MKRTLIQNAIIVNEGKKFLGSVVIAGDKIEEILRGDVQSNNQCDEIIDASGCYLMPGVIDDHVHFRDPGLEHKADILSESRAAIAGGVTSVMDMPNTSPQTTSIESLNDKLKLYKEKCLINYSCYFGATNSNTDEFKQLDIHSVCGIKLFMGSSTGNMLVDRMEVLRKIFAEANITVAAHCEDQNIISQNTKHFLEEAGSDDLPLECHPQIRSTEACVCSSKLAVDLAKEYNTRLHLLHISTADELELLSNASLDNNKRITAEACVSHLLFSDQDYKHLGTRIKCNPAIKSADDRKALRNAVNSDKIDVIATDHAPHTIGEKDGGAIKAVSGMPMIQFSLVSMLELTDENVFTIEKVVEKMCHAPATIFEINQRGYIREGYQADIILVRPFHPWVVTKDVILSKCDWSPLEGHLFNWKVEQTFVNGTLVYNKGEVKDIHAGQQLRFR